MGLLPGVRFIVADESTWARLTADEAQAAVLHETIRERAWHSQILWLLGVLTLVGSFALEIEAHQYAAAIHFFQVVLSIAMLAQVSRWLEGLRDRAVARVMGEENTVAALAALDATLPLRTAMRRWPRLFRWRNSYLRRALALGFDRESAVTQLQLAQAR